MKSKSLYLYTPRSGSKIFATSQCPMAPRWAVETLTNGSHIIHYTAPLYRVPASTRQHRADVQAILRHVARTADRSSKPRVMIAWDDRGEIGFIADERSIMDIEGIVQKFQRGGGLIEAILHAREEAEIFGSSGPDTRLFSSFDGQIIHVTNGYTGFVAPHKSRAVLEAEPATFGDLDTHTAMGLSRQLLQSLWDGMSGPVPTPEEAAQFAARFASWMDWCDDEPHREEMKSLLNPLGKELPEWANDYFHQQHLSLGWFPDYPAHWADESKEDEGEATEPTPEPTEEDPRRD